MIPVIETRGRYAWVAARSDCSSTVPGGRMSALKGRTAQARLRLLAGTGFLAQETGRTSARLTELAEAVRSR
jgi:hypothetical protein